MANIASAANRTVALSKNLRTLLTVSNHLRASNPRDHLYGLLGVVHWEPKAQKFMQWFRVDYGLPVSVVIRDAARASIIQVQSLLPMHDAEAPYSATMPSSAKDLRLPPWVPMPNARSSVTGFETGDSGYGNIDLALVQDSAPYKYILLKGFGLRNIGRVFRQNVRPVDSTLAQDFDGLSLMMDDTVKGLVGSSLENVELIKPLLQIMAQWTENVQLRFLPDQQCLQLARSVVKHYADYTRCQDRSTFTPRNPNLDPLEIFLRGERSIRTVCWNVGFFSHSAAD